jgi:ribosomal protein S18 acetylase RimI-like enzyme
MASAALDTAFALPARLVDRGYALRPETDADIDFLVGLYASTRETELAAMLHWTATQRESFVAQQFGAQRHHYRTYIAGCIFWVIEHDGNPIGRLYLERRTTRWHIVDIALLPDRRGHGIGTALLEAVIDSAQVDGRSVGLFVDRDNVALRLYRRLGFVGIGATAFHIEMERPPGPIVDRLS